MQGLEGVHSLRSRWIVVVLCLFLVGAAGVWAQGPNPTGGVTDTGDTIRLFVGRSTVIRSNWPVKTLSVTSPEVANVEALSANQVLVMAKSVGTTDITLLSDDGEHVWQARVDVVFELDRIRRKLDELFPDCAVVLNQSDDLVVLQGTLNRADQIEMFHKVLEGLKVKYVDMTKLAGVQQVQIQIRVAEASRDALKALGINALAAGSQDNTFFGASLVGSSVGGALNPVQIGPAAGVPAGLENAPFTFNSNVTVSPLVTLLAGFPRGDLQFFIQALTEDQFLRILAEPNLVALSGQDASFLAGGEFPIPVVQGTVGGGTGTAITIEYKEFGVRLNFQPTVLGENVIRLRVAPEVSDLTDRGAVEIQGFRIPAVVTRRMETTLEVQSGQTFAMAGLLQRTTQARTSRVPGLGDLPILGALFRSVRYTKGETELVVLVSASLVEPTSEGTPPPLPGSSHVQPDDWELYGKGWIEGKGKPELSDADTAWRKEMGLEGLETGGTWSSYERTESVQAGQE